MGLEDGGKKGGGEGGREGLSLLVRKREREKKKKKFMVEEGKGKGEPRGKGIFAERLIGWLIWKRRGDDNNNDNKYNL